MTQRLTGVALAFAVLAIAGCNPVHVIGGEPPPDAGDAGEDGGHESACAIDGGCPCGYGCGYSDDDHMPICFQLALSCALDGGVPGCGGSDVCRLPVAGGALCPVARCFGLTGVGSCSSDLDCPCATACAESDGGGICYPVDKCQNDFDCGRASCEEMYRNGMDCGVKQCFKDT
jgi:hypothetical protein